MKDQEEGEGENEEEVQNLKDFGYQIVENSPKNRFSRVIHS